MNDKLENLFIKTEVLFSHLHEQEFIIYLLVDGSRLLTKVSSSKYAKFLINDVGALVNKYGKQVYDIDSAKVKALFSIMDQYSWFTRKDLIEFLEFKCISGKVGELRKTVNLLPFG